MCAPASCCQAFPPPRTSSRGNLLRFACVHPKESASVDLLSQKEDLELRGDRASMIATPSICRRMQISCTEDLSI